MQISSVRPMQNNNASFKAVNKEYIKRAEQNYRDYGNIDIDWMYELGDEVRYGFMSEKDAKDTAIAAKKFVSKGSMPAFENFIKSFKV